MIDLIFNDDLLCRISANLNRFILNSGGNNGLKEAAVAFTIVDIQQSPNIKTIPHVESWPGHAAILLTKRASGLRRNAGQWALPGGRIDPGETAEEAVLRELEEEVGLKLGADQMVGRLDDYSTRSGFTITPIVVWGGTDILLNAYPCEVA